MTEFDKFRKRHGKPADQSFLAAADLAALGTRLPAPLLDFFGSDGIGAYAGGLFRTVSPLDFDDVIEDWLGPGQPAAVYAVTAFGSMFYWDGSDNHYLDVLFGDRTTIFQRIDFVFGGNLCDPDFLNDVMLGDLFADAARRLGPPAADECFGFFPALALGGAFSADSLRRVKRREHVNLLSQLVEK